MPELPEVESIARVCRFLEEKLIDKIELISDKIRYQLSPEIYQALGQTLKKVHRRAKYMVWSLEDGALIFHFGMSGVLAFRKEQKEHDHLTLTVDKHTIRYHDPRRFGMVWYVKNEDLFFKQKNIGLEPFDAECSALWLYKQAHKRHLCIKQFLFDQSIIAGLGNIYINEALFLAKIHPEKKASILTVEEWDVLIDVLRKTLIKAINLGGSTLRDYSDPQGCVGYFQQEHQVYQKQFCPLCESAIHRLVVAQRSTFFCNKCQK